ncbi:hypothetical protein E2C01_047858 [Portunus trituberculatus]|uniref:Uncharacterized protein n=1 Tax=Portunus trituberculatus TaxID=210409 RepID=A0A5B7GBN9_PORTR|nr:hypothetical protein [Portunus trituberculatus]
MKGPRRAPRPATRGTTTKSDAQRAWNSTNGNSNNTRGRTRESGRWPNGHKNMAIAACYMRPVLKGLMVKPDADGYGVTSSHASAVQRDVRKKTGLTSQRVTVVWVTL